MTLKIKLTKINFMTTSSSLKELMLKSVAYAMIIIGVTGLIVESGLRGTIAIVLYISVCFYIINKIIK